MLPGTNKLFGLQLRLQLGGRVVVVAIVDVVVVASKMIIFIK